MGKQELNPRIFEFLKTKLAGAVAESTIRPAITRIRAKNPSLTLNAAAEIYARKHGTTVHRYLDANDRASYGTILREEVGTSSRSSTIKPTYAGRAQNLKRKQNANLTLKGTVIMEKVEEKWDALYVMLLRTKMQLPDLCMICLLTLV
jgi:hypothetical protein